MASLLAIFAALYSTHGLACEGSPEVCLGVDYISFLDKEGKPLVTEADVRARLVDVNGYFRKCRIEFQLDQYQAVRAEDRGLSNNPKDADATNAIRATYDTWKYILIVAVRGLRGNFLTGKELGSANYPDNPVKGAIVKHDGGSKNRVLAHELGHYLGLRHQEGGGRLMNARTSMGEKHFADDECESMRNNARTLLKMTLR